MLRLYSTDVESSLHKRAHSSGVFVARCVDKTCDKGDGECEGESPSAEPKLLWHLHNREGHNPLALYHPYDVCFLWDQRVAVVEGLWPYSRIQLLDPAGQPMCSIAQGEILPFGVAIDSEGYMAVTDHKDRTVKFFTADGNVRFSWQSNMFDWPDGIATSVTGEYVVTDWTRGVVSIHDMDSVSIRKFSSADPNSAQYSCPGYVTIDSHRRIILTDTFDHTIKIFDKSGKLLQKLGSETVGNAQPMLKDPRGITTDKNNNIVVADWASNSILQYSPDGKFISELLTMGDGIRYPWGVCMNDAGLLLVSEQKLDSEPGLKLYQCKSDNH